MRKVQHPLVLRWKFLYLAMKVETLLRAFSTQILQELLFNTQACQGIKRQIQGVARHSHCRIQSMKAIGRTQRSVQPQNTRNEAK